MKKTFIILMLSLTAILAGSVPSDAHQGKGRHKLKHAIRELHEAKEILGKLRPDAEGHIAKASQSVDQAVEELSAVNIIQA